MTTTKDQPLDEIALYEQLSTAEKLVLETSTAPWQELQRLFAAGKVIAVDPELDLIKVATALHDDDSNSFQAWISAEQVGPVSAEQALAWFEAHATLWCVVVSPWVLVQEMHQN